MHSYWTIETSVARWSFGRRGRGSGGLVVALSGPQALAKHRSFVNLRFSAFSFLQFLVKIFAGVFVALIG